MSLDQNKRPARVPFTSEELARIIAFKKQKTEQKLLTFKASSIYKTLNLFNIAVFFMYWEVILCFFGPCMYQTKNLKVLNVKYELERDAYDRPFVKEIKFGKDGIALYNVVVGDFLKIPSTPSIGVEIGRDFIFNKNLKARFDFSETDYHLKEANPALFISGFIIVISCIAFFFDLNEHPYSLTALSILNLTALILFVFL